jgi:hypothetical protein
MPGHRLLLSVSAAVLVCLAAATPARAGCGGENHSAADARMLHRPGHRAALVIGDSTSIYAGPRLAARGMETYARGCRQMSAGLALMRARKRAGRLPHLVVLALGANGGATIGQLGEALRIAGSRRVLGLVTPRNYASAAAVMRRFAAQHADQVLLVDWRHVSAGHGSWFFADGLHVNPTGAGAYSALIAGRASGVIAPPVARLRRAATGTGNARACGTVRRAGRRLAVLILRARGATLSCRHARHIAGKPPLLGFRRWRWFDWRPARVGGWQDLYIRDARRLVVVTRLDR